MYKAPWIVRIERVYLLSVPSEEVKYDASKEERIAQDNKQKELLQVEEAKKREAEKGTASTTTVLAIHVFHFFILLSLPLSVVANAVFISF